MLTTAKSSEAKRQELKLLDELIAERRQYYRQQEALITDLVESGNCQLMGLHHDIALANQVLRELRTDIRTGRQDKVLMEEDLQTLQIEIGILVPNQRMILPSFG